MFFCARGTLLCEGISGSMFSRDKNKKMTTYRSWTHTPRTPHSRSPSWKTYDDDRGRTLRRGGLGTGGADEAELKASTSKQTNSRHPKKQNVGTNCPRCDFCGGLVVSLQTDASFAASVRCAKGPRSPPPPGEWLNACQMNLTSPHFRVIFTYEGI